MDEKDNLKEELTDVVEESKKAGKKSKKSKEESKAAESAKEEQEVKLETKKTAKKPKKAKEEKKVVESVKEKQEIKEEPEKTDKKTNKFKNLDVVEKQKLKEKSMDFKAVKQVDNDFEKQADSHNEKVKQKVKIKSTLSSICVIAVLILILTTVFALINMNNQNIIAGVEIEGIEVSGLSKEQAKSKIEEVYAEKLKNDIWMSFEEYETSINLELIQARYLIDEIVDEAYSLGRNDNIFASNFEIIKALVFGQEFEVKVEFDEDILAQTILDTEVNLPGVLIQSSYYLDEENEELVIYTGESGYKIDIEEITKLIKMELEDISKIDMFIEVPALVVDPDKIDIGAIYQEVYKDAQDAYIIEEPFEICAETAGIDFDLEEAKAILAEDEEEYVISLIITKANKTIADLGEDAFPDVISTYTTRYDASLTNRTTNLKLASNSINGVVIMPGETFSYNQALGQRTEANGYKVASIYSNGSVIDGLGGGICQISSNLYNAALMADLEIVERRNHQFVPSYVTAGRDATVVYGVTDFIFKNTRTYPIKIVSTMSNGVSTVTIDGIKEEEYKYIFTTNVIKVTSYSTQYVEDSEVEQGKETVIQNGVNGQVIEVYLAKTLNGVEIDKVLISRDTYNPMTRIISRGTKVVEEEIEVEENTETE